MKNILAVIPLILTFKEEQNHTLHTGHACESIADIMKVVKIEKRGKNLNTLDI
jgi:hypothetical protein